MSIVHEIIKQLGGVSSAAEKIAAPQQTVNDWCRRDPPEIPPWRRPIVEKAVKDAGKKLPKEAWAYLASRKRTPKAPTPAKPAAQTQAAA